MDRRVIDNKYFGIISSLGIAVLISIILILIESLVSKSSYYFFLIYNIALALISPAISVALVERLRTKYWLDPLNVLISLIWLSFLPNTFYMISDMIHVTALVGISELYNIIFITLLVFIGLVSGISSLYLIHKELLKRVYYKYAHGIIFLVIIITSFAIYLGRYLRWNTWDIVINPAGLLFDSSDTILHPSTHPDIVPVTVAFSLTIGAMYLIVWQFISYFKKNN